MNDFMVSNNNSNRNNWNKKINNSINFEQFNSLSETDKKKVYLRIFLEV